MYISKYCISAVMSLLSNADLCTQAGVGDLNTAGLTELKLWGLIQYHNTQTQSKWNQIEMVETAGAYGSISISDLADKINVDLASDTPSLVEKIREIVEQVKGNALFDDHYKGTLKTLFLDELGDMGWSSSSMDC